MKHLIEYSLYESASPDQKNIAHGVYTALMLISGLPEAFQEQMLLGRGNCAHGIMHIAIDYDRFKRELGQDCPISREDFEEAQSVYQDEVNNYKMGFNRWHDQNPDGVGDDGVLRITNHLVNEVPYTKLLSLLTMLERSALSKGRTEIQPDDFKGRDAEYSLNYQPIDAEMNSGDVGKTAEKILLALGFDRGDLPRLRNVWTKIK